MYLQIVSENTAVCNQDMRLPLIKHFTIIYSHSSETEAEGTIQQSIKVSSALIYSQLGHELTRRKLQT